jgi:hypothetical protein
MENRAVVIYNNATDSLHESVWIVRTYYTVREIVEITRDNVWRFGGLLASDNAEIVGSFVYSDDGHIFDADARATNPEAMATAERFMIA